MQKLSVFIITLNEEKTLAKCIEAIREIADEIIVLDSGSTDRTEQIARNHGAAFFMREFDGFGQQKRAAEALCRHRWVLNLDADEHVTPELRAEIGDFLSSDVMTGRYDGGRLKTVGVYPHHRKPRLFANYHNYIRLYRKDILRFPNHPTHDAVEPTDKSRIYQFRDSALHYSFESLNALELKTRNRTRFYFEQEKRGHIVKNATRLAIEYPVTFLKCYVTRRHITGGIYGLRVSHIFAKYRFLRILQRVLGRCVV